MSKKNKQEHNDSSFQPFFLIDGHNDSPHVGDVLQMGPGPCGVSLDSLEDLLKSRRCHALWQTVVIPDSNIAMAKVFFW